MKLVIVRRNAVSEDEREQKKSEKEQLVMEPRKAVNDRSKNGPGGLGAPRGAEKYFAVLLRG